ncbi:MAG: glycosyltransferase family 39 protein [Fimbriimonadales bacterium]|nr:glycosyltransferase family 39 protein [Fimbriimonadales bacterium]
MRAWQAALVLAALHAILAAGYALLTPYRTAGRVLMQGNAPALDIGAPDERQHANYVQRLLEGSGLPVFNPEDPNLYESYQSHQPPLYYALAAGWSRLVGLASAVDPEAGFRLRLLNVLIGSLGVWGLFLAGRWLTMDDRTGLMAAAIGGLLPMGCALSGAVSNDPLLIALCTFSLAFQIRATSERAGRYDLWWAALFAGLAMLTKTSGVALLPGLALAAWWSGRRRPEKRGWLRALGPALLAVAVVLPWWIRNSLLYGDPLAARAFQQAFTGAMQASQGMERVGVAGYWLEVVKGTWCSFVGVFGYWDIWLDPRLYAASALAAALGLAASLVRLRLERPAGLWVAAVFGVCVLALFVRFNLQYFQAQGRYLHPAIAAFAVWIAFGATSPRARLWPLGVAALALLALNVHALRSLPAEFKIRSELESTAKVR